MLDSADVDTDPKYDGKRKQCQHSLTAMKYLGSYDIFFSVCQAELLSLPKLLAN